MNGRVTRYMLVAVDQAEPNCGYYYWIEASDDEAADLLLRQHLADANGCELADVPFDIVLCVDETDVRDMLEAKPDIRPDGRLK